MVSSFEKPNRDKLLHDALYEAFPSYGRLKLMLHLEMEENLEKLAGNGNQALDHVILELIIWAKSQTQEQELVRAALRSSPGSRKLRAYAEQFHI